MRKIFDEELEELFDHLTSLGNAANESVHKSLRAYNTRDKELANELFSDDLRINADTMEIEQAAYRLIVLQQPVASDLRMIFAVLHASSDIERIADHAVSIARAVIRRDENEVDVPRLDDKINKMGELVSSMITDVVTAFRHRDVKLAKEIASRDDEVDNLRREIAKETTKRMEDDTDVVVSGLTYMNVSSRLERIGDYVTNICERILYLETGELTELN